MVGGGTLSVSAVEGLEMLRDYRRVLIVVHLELLDLAFKWGRKLVVR